MATLEAFCLRQAVGKMTRAVLQELRGLQNNLVAARKAKDTARASALDRQFHMRMCEVAAAELPQTLQILRNLFDRGEYYRIVMHARRGGFAKESVTEHEDILSALEAQDVRGASRAIERHRVQAMRRLEETT